MTRAAEPGPGSLAPTAPPKRGPWFIPGVFVLFVIGLAGLVLLKLWVLARMLLG